jgi:hypothetical protein
MIQEYSNTKKAVLTGSETDTDNFMKLPKEKHKRVIELPLCSSLASRMIEIS